MLRIDDLDDPPRRPLDQVEIDTDLTARQLEGDEKAAWWARATEVWPDYDTYQASTERIAALEARLAAFESAPYSARISASVNSAAAFEDVYPVI